MSTAKEAVACTASRLAPRSGLTSTTSMTDSKPAGGTFTGQTHKRKQHVALRGAAKRTCVVDFLCEVDSLPVGQTTVDGRSRGRSQRGVECIDVEAQVDRPLCSG